MRYLLIKLIKLYQLLPFAMHSYCRLQPTCSNYAIIALEQHGLRKGLILTAKRLGRCRPGGTFGYDPVPIRRNE